MRISFVKWLCLTYGLRKRGLGRRESGAFLVGKSGSDKISKIIFYDDIDPDAFKSGIITLNGIAHGKLNEVLLRYDGEVLADIHTHPTGCSTMQSDSDKKHPISRIKGHIAFIAPNYATNFLLMPRQCGAYLYEGSFQWKTLNKENFPLNLTLI